MKYRKTGFDLQSKPHTPKKLVIVRVPEEEADLTEIEAKTQPSLIDQLEQYLNEPRYNDYCFIVISEWGFDQVKKITFECPAIEKYDAFADEIIKLQERITNLILAREHRK